MKKYEFTGETIEYKGRILKRIRRISDGLVGGWIEKEENLSHYGSCFIYDDAKVFDAAMVYGNAEVFDNAEVFGYAWVYGNAWIYGNARVHGNAKIKGDAKVYDNAKIDKGNITGEVQIPYEEIEFHQSYNTRQVTAIKTLDGIWLFNVGCQKLLDKEEFLDRIYNTDGGLEENPHREFYLRMLKMF